MRLPTLAFAMFMGLSVGALAANLTIAQEGFAKIPLPPQCFSCLA